MVVESAHGALVLLACCDVCATTRALMHLVANHRVFPTALAHGGPHGDSQSFSGLAPVRVTQHLVTALQGSCALTERAAHVPARRCSHCRDASREGDAGASELA